MTDTTGAEATETTTSETTTVSVTTTSSASAADQVTNRTSLSVALDRMGINLPPADLYDEDEHSILHGYNEEAMDLMTSRIREQFPDDADAVVIISVITGRADRSFGAVWLDSDQRAVVALMLNRIADRIPQLPEPKARVGVLARLGNLFRLKASA